MSETNTQATQTMPKPEQSPYREPLPEGEASRQVRELIGDGLPDNEKALPLDKLVKKIGPESLQGLSFDVNNRINKKASPLAGSKKYVVREVDIVPKAAEWTEHVILPDSPEGIGDHIPFIYTRGGVFNFGKRLETKKRTVEKPTFMVDKYNADGELENVVIYSQEKLLKFIETADINEVAREGQTKETGPPHKAHEVKLRTNPHGMDAFNEITAQLEAQGIYDWAGLGWLEVKEREPIEDKRLDVVKSVEIIRQVTLAEKVGNETKPLRAFVVSETVYNQGVASETRKVVKGAAIRPYLEAYKDKDKTTVRNMRLVQEAMAAPAYEAGIDEQEMEERTRAHLETFIHAQMSEAPDSKISDMDADGKLAWWLLSYSDVKDPEGEGARQERHARLHDVLGTTEGPGRIAAIKELISIHGTAKVYALAKKLRDDFVAQADSLNLPTEFTDVRETKETAAQSMSWVLEDLADIHYFGKHPDDTDAEHAGLELSDPFGTDIAANHQQRNIVARQLAASFMSEAVHRNVVPKPDINEDGEVVEVPKEIFILSPGIVRKIPDLTKGATAQMVEKVYERVDNKQTVLWTDLVKLGNELQRGIGK